MRTEVIFNEVYRLFFPAFLVLAMDVEDILHK